MSMSAEMPRSLASMVTVRGAEGRAGEESAKVSKGAGSNGEGSQTRAAAQARKQDLLGGADGRTPLCQTSGRSAQGGRNSPDERSSRQH